MGSVVIRISPETRELLKQRAAKDQTYDQIIQEMVEVYDALMAEFERMLRDTPEREWISHRQLLKDLGLTEEEIERERVKLD